MADHAEAELRALGASIERIAGENGFADILPGRVPGDADGPGMLLLGHRDTVHPVGTLGRPLPFRIEGERAYGLGIYDMKGGNAIAIAALKHLHATGRRPHMPVTVMMIPDEEAGSPSSRARNEAETQRHAIVLVAEPSGQGGRLTIARHGIARFHPRTIGVPAHAGAVEAEAEVHGRLLGLRPVNPDVRLEVRRGPFRPPYVKTPAIQALDDHAAALARDLAFPVAGERVTGCGSDGRLTGGLGVPTLDGLGVIGGGPHTHREHLLIPCLVPRTTLWVRLFETLDASLASDLQPAGSSAAM